MRIFLAISALFLASLIATEKTSYKGFKLVLVTIEDRELIEKINSFEYDDPEFDVWAVQKENERYVITVMLSPKVFKKYMNVFKSLGVSVEIAVDNVQHLLDEQEKSMNKNQADEVINRFAKYNEIRNFVKDTADANSDLVSTYVAGYSVENRELLVARFKTASATRGLWIDCGIHAREWVTPATCVYIIDQIIKEYRAGNAETVKLLNKYEIHILPVYNPDGYEFSHSTTRLWRKNRAKNGILGACPGVDLNRNADFRWNTGGASSLTCSDVYAGPNGGSEPETKAVAQTLSANADLWDAYFSVHSYGNWWLLPWGHTTVETERPPTFNELLDNGNVGAAAIRAKFGQVFTVGSSAELLYITTGSTADWAFGVLNIPFSATLELRPGNTTSDYNYGFQLPEDRLPQVTEETWAGIKAAFLDISTRRP